MGWGHFQLIPRVSIKFEKHEHKLIFKIRRFPPKESKMRHYNLKQRFFQRDWYKDQPKTTVLSYNFSMLVLLTLFCANLIVNLSIVYLFFMGFILLGLDFKLVKICSRQELWQLDQAGKIHVSSMWGFEIQLCQVVGDWLAGRPTHQWVTRHSDSSFCVSPPLFHPHYICSQYPWIYKMNF